MLCGWNESNEQPSDLFSIIKVIYIIIQVPRASQSSLQETRRLYQECGGTESRWDDRDRRGTLLWGSCFYVAPQVEISLDIHWLLMVVNGCGDRRFSREKTCLPPAEPSRQRAAPPARCGKRKRTMNVLCLRKRIEMMGARD